MTPSPKLSRFYRLFWKGEEIDTAFGREERDFLVKEYNLAFGGGVWWEGGYQQLINETRRSMGLEDHPAADLGYLMRKARRVGIKHITARHTFNHEAILLVEYGNGDQHRSEWPDFNMMIGWLKSRRSWRGYTVEVDDARATHSEFVIGEKKR